MAKHLINLLKGSNKAVNVRVQDKNLRLFALNVETANLASVLMDAKIWAGTTSVSIVLLSE